MGNDGWRVASLDPQEGFGESVVNLWRYLSASKIRWTFGRLGTKIATKQEGRREGRRVDLRYEGRDGSQSENTSEAQERLCVEWQRGYPKRGRFEIFWDWNRRYADNGLVWRNVDPIICLGAILFPAVCQRRLDGSQNIRDITWRCYTCDYFRHLSY